VGAAHGEARKREIIVKDSGALSTCSSLHFLGTLNATQRSHQGTHKASYVLLPPFREDCAGP